MTQRTYVPVLGPDPAEIPPLGSITALQPNPVAPDPLRPMKTLVASAKRLTSAAIKDAKGARQANSEQWQEDAWEMYDLVGEMRFLTNVVASQGSKARFFVGRIPDNPTDPPSPVEDDRLASVLEAIGDGPSGLSQLIKRLLLNLQVPGDGWLVGIPEMLLPGRGPAVSPMGVPEVPIVSLADVNLDDLEWRMLSVSEVKFDNSKVTLVLGGDGGDTVTTTPDDVYLIRVWGPHPRKAWEADSPTRSALPVLRELVGLTMHISSQIDSRLAGAGVLIAPDSAARAAKRALNLPEDGPDDPFTEALIEAMITPISDRANASAYVPLVWTVPDESAALFRHMTFDKDLDAQAKDMRDEAIRRYALSADAPPELLLGTGGMNHWGAWLVSEETVRTHIEPTLALISDAITTQYLRPVMKELGYTDDVIDSTVIWYDVEHLIVRPSRTGDALAAHSAGVISDTALRAAYGFSDDDAPPVASGRDEAVAMALDMVKQSPGLAQVPGLPALVEQLREVLSGGTPITQPAQPAPPVEPTTEGGPPTEIAEPNLDEPLVAAGRR